MKKFLKISFATLGIVVAMFFAGTQKTHATQEEPIKGGGCVGDGNCGTTANGTVLVGKWVEVN